MRRGAAWLAAVPLMLGSSQLAHAVAYRLAYPQAHVRVVRMLATGHAYFTQLPLVLAAAGACLLLSLVVTALSITLMARHRQGELTDAHWLEEYETTVIGSSTPVHGLAFRRKRDSEPIVAGWIGCDAFTGYGNFSI